MKTTKKMQDGGPIQLRPIPGQKKDTTAGPVDYSKMGRGLLPKGTIVDSKYSRDKKLKESKLNNKMQKGGSKKSKDSIEDKLVKRYPNYLGKDTKYDSVKKGVKDSVKGAKTVAKTVVKLSPAYQAAKGTDDFLEKRYPNYFGKGTMYSKVKKGIKSVFQNGGTTKMKMVKKGGIAKKK